MNPDAPVTATVLDIAGPYRCQLLPEAFYDRIVSDQPFGDIPLFREIQKILASGSGPLNLEIARQVATAVATDGASEPGKDPSVEGSLRDAVRDVEVQLSGYTRLPLVEPMTVEAISRVAWAERTLEGWRWLLEHLAQRFAAGPEAGPEEESPVPQILGQIAPLLFGMQAGGLIGHLARETLGRYDLPIPRRDDGRLFFVEPNITSVITEFGFDTRAFHRYLAAIDAARHLLMTSVPWLGSYARNLFTSMIDEIEIDVADLERRMSELQSGSLEALQGGFGNEDLLPLVPTEGHRRALGRVQALIAVFEGYASHAASVISVDTIPDLNRIEEGSLRRKASPTSGQRALQGLLGLSLDRSLEASGTTFCAAVVKLRGIVALNTLWEAPDNLPVADEVRDPFAWMERVLDG